MTYYKDPKGEKEHGGSGSCVAQAKAGVKMRNWGKFYSLIEAMQIGYEEPGTCGSFQLEGIFGARSEALYEIGELERFRKEFQALKLPRAVLDRRFEITARLKAFHRGDPPRKYYWVQLSFSHLPKDVNPLLSETWKIIVPE